MVLCLGLHYSAHGYIIDVLKLPYWVKYSSSSHQTNAFCVYSTWINTDLDHHSNAKLDVCSTYFKFVLMAISRQSNFLNLHILHCCDKRLSRKAILHLRVSLRPYSSVKKNCERLWIQAAEISFNLP